eukprot:IDg20971t1
MATILPIILPWRWDDYATIRISSHKRWQGMDLADSYPNNKRYRDWQLAFLPIVCLPSSRCCLRTRCPTWNCIESARNASNSHVSRTISSRASQSMHDYRSFVCVFKNWKESWKSSPGLLRGQNQMEPLLRITTQAICVVLRRLVTPVRWSD